MCAAAAQQRRGSAKVREHLRNFRSLKYEAE
jgi:hypothetical protein